MFLNLHDAKDGETLWVVNVSKAQMIYAIEYNGRECTKIKFDNDNWCIVSETVDEVIAMMNK